MEILALKTSVLRDHLKIAKDIFSFTAQHWLPSIFLPDLLKLETFVETFLDFD